jgi:hypothetical protein
MDPDLWGKVLEPDNKFRRQVIDQVGRSMCGCSSCVDMLLSQTCHA